METRLVGDSFFIFPTILVSLDSDVQVSGWAPDYVDKLTHSGQ